MEDIFAEVDAVDCGVRGFAVCHDQPSCLYRHLCIGRTERTISFVLKPIRKRKLVDAMRGELDVSIRWTCRVFEIDTSTYYKSRRPGQATFAMAIGVFTSCFDAKAGATARKELRIYRELGLQLRNKTPKRRVKAKLLDDRRPAARSNEIWTMDFVHDQLATGR